jgi:hypothetical protein
MLGRCALGELAKPAMVEPSAIRDPRGPRPFLMPTITEDDESAVVMLHVHLPRFQPVVFMRIKHEEGGPVSAFLPKL